MSISEVVDEVIQNCPIDVRRPLYKVSVPWWVGLAAHCIVIVILDVILILIG